MNDLFLSEPEAQAINNLMPGNQVYGVGNKLKNALNGASVGAGWKNENERLFVHPEGDNSNDGLSWDKPFRTIQAALNKARYMSGTTTVDSTKYRRVYVFVYPGQYNEQLIFSGYNISLIGLGIGNISNGEYGVVVNYNDAILATGVISFYGAGIEIANICFQSSQAIPIMLAGSGGNLADGCYIHNCWFKGNSSKTCTIGISVEIKNSLIEKNIINGCITGINIDAGKQFHNTIVQDNKITNVTNGIAIANTAVCTESEISHNRIIGSSTSIVNSQATDIILFMNAVKPALSDAGAAEGDNTVLS